jgi:hypothetical protein
MSLHAEHAGWFLQACSLSLHYSVCAASGASAVVHHTSCAMIQYAAAAGMLIHRAWETHVLVTAQHMLIHHAWERRVMEGCMLLTWPYIYWCALHATTRHGILCI